MQVFFCPKFVIWNLTFRRVRPSVGSIAEGKTDAVARRGREAQSILLLGVAVFLVCNSHQIQENLHFNAGFFCLEFVALKQDAFRWVRTFRPLSRVHALRDISESLHVVRLPKARPTQSPAWRETQLILLSMICSKVFATALFRSCKLFKVLLGSSPLPARFSFLGLPQSSVHPELVEGRSYFTPLVSHILTRRFGCSSIQEPHFVLVTDCDSTVVGVVLLWEGACAR